MYSRTGNFLKADLAKTTQRQIRTAKRGERTEHDLRCSIFRSVIGQLVKSARAIVRLSLLWAFSICQNWPAGPLPNQSVWKWKRLFPRVFAEKPSPSCILFRNWLTWLESFDSKGNLRREWCGWSVLTNGKRPKSAYYNNERLLSSVRSFLGCLGLLNPENSSVKKQIYSCQIKDYLTIIPPAWMGNWLF